MGCQPRRNGPGVDQHTFHAEHDPASYNEIVKLGSRINHLMDMFIDTDDINTIEEASALVGHPVLRPTEGDFGHDLINGWLSCYHINSRDVTAHVPRLM